MHFVTRNIWIYIVRSIYMWMIRNKQSVLYLSKTMIYSLSLNTIQQCKWSMDCVLIIDHLFGKNEVWFMVQIWDIL